MESSTTTVSQDALTSEGERLLLRLVYFPDQPPSDMAPALEQQLIAAGLTRREWGRLVVTEEGLRYFTSVRRKAVAPYGMAA